MPGASRAVAEPGQVTRLPPLIRALRADLGGLVAPGALWYSCEVPDGREWLFDLDNTLYPPETGLFGAVDARINEFLARHLGLAAPAADALRSRYHDQYGITLVGLMVEHGTEPHHYLDFVHEVAVGDYLAAGPDAARARRGAPGRRSIFTNGSRRHALAVLAALGLVDLFEEIFDIAALGFRPKPEPATYRAVLARLGAARGPSSSTTWCATSSPPVRSGCAPCSWARAAPPPTPTLRWFAPGAARDPPAPARLSARLPPSCERGAVQPGRRNPLAPPLPEGEEFP